MLGKHRIMLGKHTAQTLLNTAALYSEGKRAITTRLYRYAGNNISKQDARKSITLRRDWKRLS
jgi:hypothetical protein